MDKEMKGDTHNQRNKTQLFQDSKTLSTHLQFSFFFSYLFFLPPEQMKTKKTNFLFFFLKKKKGALHETILFTPLRRWELQDHRPCILIISTPGQSYLGHSHFFSPWGHLQGHRKANSCKQGAQVMGEVKSLHPVNTNTGFWSVLFFLEMFFKECLFVFFV